MAGGEPAAIHGAEEVARELERQRPVVLEQHDDELVLIGRPHVRRVPLLRRRDEREGYAARDVLAPLVHDLLLDHLLHVVLDAERRRLDVVEQRRQVGQVEVALVERVRAHVVVGPVVVLVRPEERVDEELAAHGRSLEALRHALVLLELEQLGQRHLGPVHDRVEVDGQQVGRLNGLHAHGVVEPAAAEVVTGLGRRRDVPIEARLLFARLEVARHVQVLEVGLGPRHVRVHLVDVEAMGALLLQLERLQLDTRRLVLELALHVDEHRALAHPEHVLLDEAAERLVEYEALIGVLGRRVQLIRRRDELVEGHAHLRQIRRLAAVEVVDARAVGHEAELLDQIHVVLDELASRVIHAAHAQALLLVTEKYQI